MPIMGNTSIDFLSVSDLRRLISLKDHEYKAAIRNGRTFEEVENIFKERKELEKELARKENRIN